ncbi:MAG TPA: hypothetical protein VHC41_07255, partial [Mycobacteriales bacterium]|nr:hypothetical protein [Mycobacteriales bacterium]
FRHAGTATVKVHASPLWQTDTPGSCIEDDDSTWLRIHSDQPGRVDVEAQVSAGTLLHVTPSRCSGN